MRSIVWPLWQARRTRAEARGERPDGGQPADAPADAADSALRHPRRLWTPRMGAGGVHDRRHHRRPRRGDCAAVRAAQQPGRVAGSDGGQAAARDDVRHPHLAEPGPHEPAADLADRAHHFSRRRHRAHRRDRQPGERSADVPPVGARQNRHRDLHPDGRRRDVVQFSRLPFDGVRSVCLRIARDHARVRTALHLARAPDHRRAAAGGMTRAAIAVALLAVGAGSVVGLQAQVPKQAVVETTAGTFVIDLTPESAPVYLPYFLKLVDEHAYDGTTFHRVVKYGMVQGGDPLSKDPAKQAQYGTGGLNAVKADIHAPKMTRGSVAAVLVPGKPDSAGSQFFVALADQPALDGKYTVFGHVADGMDTLQKISETPVDANGLATERV